MSAHRVTSMGSDGEWAPNTHPSRTPSTSSSILDPSDNPLAPSPATEHPPDVDELVDIFAELGEKATQRELKALVRKFGHEEKDDFVVDFEVRDPSSDHSEGSSPTPRTQRS